MSRVHRIDPSTRSTRSWPRRMSLAGAILLGALSLWCLLAQAEAAAQPAVPPEILSTSPYEGMPSGWGGEAVLVTYAQATVDGEPDPLDPDRCQLSINGRRVRPTATTVLTAAYGSTIQFVGIPRPDPGVARFSVVLITQAGQQTEAKWRFEVPADERQGLVNLAIVRQWWPYIARGALTTVYICVVSIALACVFALIGALARLSGRKRDRGGMRSKRSAGVIVGNALRQIPYWLATVYVSVFRGTPLLLQIYVIYYAIPAVILWLQTRWGAFESLPSPNPIVSGVAALSLNYGAFLTEVFRAGIQAVPKGQAEAAWALGLSWWQTQRRVILPQALKIVVPAIGNDFILLIKDTALISVISVEEVLRRSQLVGGRYYDFLTPLLVAAAVYWVLSAFFTFWQRRLEHRLEHDRVTA